MAKQQQISDYKRAFIEQGYEESEAHVFAMRLSVMTWIEEFVRAKGWGQTETARRMSTTQPRVSQIRKGRWENFTLDTLLVLATRIGLRIELKLVR